MGRGDGTRGAEHPLHVDRYPQPAGMPGVVAERQPGNLDRVGHGHELQQLTMNPMGGMVEAAVALAVADDVAGIVHPDRQGRGRPEFTGSLVAEIKHLARRIADRIVRPGRQLVFMTVARPGAAGAGFRNHEAEFGIGDDIDPGSGRPLPLVEHDHVFPAVVGESAQPIEKFQRGQGRQAGRRFGRSRRRARDELQRRPPMSQQLLGQGAPAAGEHRARGGFQQQQFVVREAVGAQHENCPVLLRLAVRGEVLRVPYQAFELLL